jgi:hypothetical protein
MPVPAAEPLADGIINLAHLNFLSEEVEVGDRPIQLEAGQHTLRLTYAGRDSNRSTIVDALLLAPAVVTQHFAGPDGAKLTLRYDMPTADLQWLE